MFITFKIFNVVARKIEKRGNNNKADNITELDRYTFYNCYNLKSVSIGKNVTKLNSNVFANCGMLESIVFEDTTDWYYTNDQEFWESQSGGRLLNVSNTTNNVKYFTDTYQGYYWYKK